MMKKVGSPREDHAYIGLGASRIETLPPSYQIEIWESLARKGVMLRPEGFSVMYYDSASVYPTRLLWPEDRRRERAHNFMRQYAHHAYFLFYAYN